MITNEETGSGSRRCFRCPSNLSAVTSTASAPCTWMAVWKWRPPITARRQAGSDAMFRCSGMPHMSVSNPITGQLLREHLGDLSTQAIFPGLAELA